MIPTLTAFAQSPDRGRGLARDMRVRWALEEVGQPYDVRLVSFEEMKQPPHLALHPFGQIPTYEDGEATLFESGAIVLHLAERRPGLLPDDPGARARAISWAFAALNTVEPPLLDLEIMRREEQDRPWYAERRGLAQDRADRPLRALSGCLDEAEWLDGPFTAGDLMIAAVLFRTKASGILEPYPNLVSYIARAEARPAFQRAIAAQLAVFEAVVAREA